MSTKSNDQGRAYEYICLFTLNAEINKVRKAVIEENSSFHAALHAWNNIDAKLQNTLTESANAAVQTIFDFEPLILEDGDDQLDLKIQPDSEGESGDVRDILIIRRNIQWEIGLSIKHNHFAVKHSRLAKTLDFGEKWFGVKCSDQYWKDINPIFTYLEEEKKKRSKWSDLPDKENDVYIPLLQAFVDELQRSNYANPDIPKKMVEYLLGEFDFYKVIVHRREKKHPIYYCQESDPFFAKISGIVTDKSSIYRVYHDSIKITKNHMCPTLTASMGTRKNQVPLVIDDYGIRELTLRECLSFQGFPTEFYFPNTITIGDAYKQIGNSVCVTVIRRIAEQIKEISKTNDRSSSRPDMGQR